VNVNSFIKGFTSRITATAVAIVMMLASLASFAMLISIVTAETPTVPIPHTARYKMVAGGQTHSLGIRLDGSLWAWGNNRYGQLGIGEKEEEWGDTSADRYTPVQVGTDTDWAYVSAGDDFSVGLKQDGSLWSWGSNHIGQLGHGDSGREIERTVPTQVGVDTDWATITTGEINTFGIKTDGSLWAWGDNWWGQLGLGDIGSGTERTVPTRVGEDNNWKQIALWYHVLGVRTDGSLWSWGFNLYGCLGLGDSGNGTQRTVPTQVGNDYDWAHISAELYSSMGIRDDGSLWVWGDNTWRKLGLGDSSPTIAIAVPTRVGVDNDWKHVSAGNGFGLGIRQDGSLWSWGANSLGSLGLGDSGWTTNRASPTQVGSYTGWVYISTGQISSLGIQADGSLWVWGGNRSGELGIGNHGDYDAWSRWEFYNILTPFGPTPEQLEPLPKDPPPDLSYVNIGSDDDNKAFVDIDEERIEDEKLTFRWWRRVGNGEWEELDVPPNQPWVDIELDDDEDVTYKVDIYVDNEFLLARERIFNALPPPPAPQNRFYGFAIPTAIAICIAFVCLITLIVIIIIRRREEQKNKQRTRTAS